MGNGKTAVFFLIFFLIFVSVAPLFSAGLLIDEVYFSEGNVYVSMESSVTDAVDIFSYVEDGIELNVEYNVTVYRKTGFLSPDVEITNVPVTFIARKDFINNGYEVNAFIDGQIKDYWYYDASNLYYRLIRIDSLKLVSIEHLRDTEPEPSDYYVIAQVSFTTLELYPPLSIIYNLLGNWNFNSKRIKSRIFRVDGIVME